MTFRLTPRKIRFSLVSTTATSLDFGALLLLTSVGSLSLIHANYISSSVGFIYSFIANKKFTFKTPTRHVHRELILYLAVTLFGIWVIQPLIMWPIEHLLRTTGWHHWVIIVIAKVIASLATFIWNYYTYSRLVFTKTNDREA